MQVKSGMNDKHAGLGMDEAALTEQVADAMKAASRAYVEALVRDLAVAGYTGLTPAKTALISRIPADGATASALAQVASRSKQAVGKLVLELENAGYVRRIPDPDDKRGQLAVLTDRGRQVVEDGVRIKARLAMQASAVLGEERMERLHRDLEALTRLLASRF